MIKIRSLSAISCNLLALCITIPSCLTYTATNSTLPESSFSMKPVQQVSQVRTSHEPTPQTTAKPSAKSRKKTKKEKEKKKKSGLRNMSYADLKDAKNRALANKDIDGATKFLEKMVPICNDLIERHDLMLETADILFQGKNYTKAGTIYQEFITLYPGSTKLEYAHYKAIACNFHQMSDAERDQTKTKDTIELSKSFLEREAIFTTYTSHVKDMLAECQKRLMESDLNVLNFYIHRGHFKSAQKRLELLRADFVPVLPKAEPQILSLEYEVARAQNNTQLALEKKLALEKQFPEFSKELLEVPVSKRTMASRF